MSLSELRPGRRNRGFNGKLIYLEGLWETKGAAGSMTSGTVCDSLGTKTQRWLSVFFTADRCCHLRNLSLSCDKTSTSYSK